MHLRASGRSAARERLEFALRIVALAALVLGVLQVAGISGAPKAEGELPVVFKTANTAHATTQALVTVSKRMLIGDLPSANLHVVAAAVPDDGARSLLSALRGAGVPVRWTDSTAQAAIALEVTSLIDPKGGVLLRAASTPGVSLAFRDSLGLIDTVRTRAGGSSMTIGRVAGAIQLSSPGASATTVAPPSPIIRRILVLASPGWEAKFTVAALEERGWNVDVRYALGKNVTTTQGDPRIADTARYAAVVALDSSALSHVAELRRYAGSGGGLLIAGAAGTLREFGDLLPGTMGAEQPGIPGAVATAAPLAGISWRGITPDSDAVVLMRSGRSRSGPSASSDAALPHAGSATVVARRYGAGRVVLIAYGALWQWRMAGPEGSVEAHRQWWSNMIALVAFAPDTVTSVRTEGVRLPGSAAPYADLVARLGTAAAMPARRADNPRTIPWELLLLITAVAALLLEWASRRLRGAR